MIKGLLTSASKSGATNTAKQAVKKTAAGGIKKFAKGMIGQTSADYKARVEGKGEDGEYLSPEERKARFKGFTLGTKKQKDTPTAARLALPSGSDDATGGSKGPAAKLTDHLVKVREYLEKLLVLENNAIGRLHDRILGTAREIDDAAADAEEAKQERGKVRGARKKDGPIMKGIKKKAGGIFDFLMTFGKMFVGFKLLQWLGDPANQVKVTAFIEFFQGVIKWVGDVAKAIGTGITWTVDKLKEGIEIAKETVAKLGEFFSFEWFDKEAFQEQLDSIVKIFTEGIPKLFEELNTWLTVDLPEMFAGISESVGNFFEPVTNFFTETIPNMFGEISTTVGDFFSPMTTFITETIPDIFNEIIGNVSKKISQLFGFDDDESDVEFERPKKEKGGLLKGRSHNEGGIPIEAEGGEYILNKEAAQGIEKTMPGFLDRMNFGMFPANKPVGNRTISKPSFHFGGYVGPSFTGGTGSTFNSNVNLTVPKYELGGQVNATTTVIPSRNRSISALRLDVAQKTSNTIDLGMGTDQLIIQEAPAHFTTGAEETAFDTSSLGDNLPPMHQCVYGVRL